MFRTVHIKLVGIFILLIVSLMTVVGSFLMLQVTRFYLNQFSTAMSQAFSQPEFVSSLREATNSGDTNQLKERLRAYSGLLGIDLSQRHYYILDSKSGAVITGSDDRTIDLTPNIVTALTGLPGYAHQLSSSYMDCAVPISSGEFTYIIYVRDERTTQQALNVELFLIIVEALLFGLIIAVLLSFVLSKTMTNPIEQLTRSAQLVASGEFSTRLPVHTADEIGVLTKTFNDMASILQETLEAVGNERDKLNILFLHMNDGVAAFRRDGTLLHMNPAAERMLRQPFTENLTFDALFANVLPFAEVLALAPRQTIERQETVAGRKLTISVTTFGAPNVEAGVMVLIYDVTEKARLDQMRREFVSSVSHELRTPLTNVKSYAETLSNPEGLDPDVISRFSHVIVGEADRMTRIVSDLFTLSRFDYGKMDWHVTTFPVENLLKSAFEAMRLEANRHGQTLSLELPTDLPKITADQARLEQVLVNILSNAIRYTPDKGVIEMTAGVAHAQIWISVSDSGIGIPQNEIAHVFERFYRVDKARSRASGGTGLGLSIASEILQKHGGDISIQSAEKQGTTVTVKLPLHANMQEELS